MIEIVFFLEDNLKKIVHISLLVIYAVMHVIDIDIFSI